MLVKTAKEWGLRPSDFGVCYPDDDRAVMLAFEKTTGDMQAVEKWKAEHRGRR